MPKIVVPAACAGCLAQQDEVIDALIGLYGKYLTELQIISVAEQWAAVCANRGWIPDVEVARA